MMKWEAEQKGYTCNDCYLSMQNCHDKSICCEDETGLCDFFEELADKGEQNEKDLIIREDAIKAITTSRFLVDAMEKIIKLPSAQPEHKTGHWIKTARWGRVYYCDQCRNYLDFDGVNAGRGSTNFCPNCGADMRGGQDE